MTVEGISFPFLLDTGAELSVMSKQVLQSTALPQPLDFYRLRNQAGDVFLDKIVRSFGGHPLTLEGSFVFTVFVCGIQLKHPFYTLDLPTPFVAGYDFITAAALLIDPVARRVCSTHTTGSSSNDSSLITPTAPTTLLNIVVNSPTLHDPVHASNTDTARLCHSKLTGDRLFIPNCDVTNPKTLCFSGAQSPLLSSSSPDFQDNLNLLPQQPVNSTNALLFSSLSRTTSCISPHFITSRRRLTAARLLYPLLSYRHTLLRHSCQCCPLTTHHLPHSLCLAHSVLLVLRLILLRLQCVFILQLCIIIHVLVFPTPVLLRK